jgi:hypothetical protein
LLGLTLPATVTWRTATVAPLVGALMETETLWEFAGDPPAPHPAASAAVQIASGASLVLARIGTGTAR